eukprot:scaffold5704_cov174-Amphora_coffeaeformis.AAC.1
MTPFQSSSGASSSSAMSTTTTTTTAKDTANDEQQDEPFPTFRYNAAPLETIRSSSLSSSSSSSYSYSSPFCACCRRDRGYLYTTLDGTVEVCPWCLADGTAHLQFPDAIMNDCDLVVQQQQQEKHQFEGSLYADGWNSNIIPKQAWHELMYQTPRFIAWQDTLWWTHCGDAAVYQGMGGWDEIQAAGPAAAEYFLQYYLDQFHGSKETWEAFARKTGKDYDRTAYLFSCRHCKAWGGYMDMK